MTYRVSIKTGSGPMLLGTFDADDPAAAVAAYAAGNGWTVGGPVDGEWPLTSGDTVITVVAQESSAQG